MPLKHSLKKILISSGIYKEVPPSKSDLKMLLTSIRPIETDINLIRVGEHNDGGYLIPNDLEGITAVFSPGVAEYAKFEEYFATRGIPCFLADYSVDKPPVDNRRFYFLKKYLGRKNSEKYIKLSTWLHNSGVVGSDSILQMDIEAAEWLVLPHIPSRLLRRFRIIIVEFHDLPDVFFKQSSFKMAKKLFTRILKDFYLVHIHQNNCCGQEGIYDFTVPRLAELTFIRKDRVLDTRGYSIIPNELDSPNVPGRPELDIPLIWKN